MSFRWVQRSCKVVLMCENEALRSYRKICSCNDEAFVFIFFWTIHRQVDFYEA